MTWIFIVLALPVTWGAAIVFEPFALLASVVATRREPPCSGVCAVRLGVYVYVLLAVLFVGWAVDVLVLAPQRAA